ncbi:MAG: glycosyltransferase [Pseudomonadota bacterium]
MRVAIVHYWLLAERGGEKVLQAIANLYPQADLFFCVADTDIANRLFPGRRVHTSLVQRLPFSKRLYQFYLPLMPLALEQFDLQGYDLVISSESGPAKGVIVPPDALHVCYCHSPMRYLWDHYHHYMDDAGSLARFAMAPMFHRLRQWDVTSAARVDAFAANSRFVRKRIRKYYRRDADVVHPPVDLNQFALRQRTPGSAFADAYLWVGQLTAYKRPELALQACRELGRRIVVIGTGEQEARLQSIGADAVFLGRVDGDQLAEAYANARALIFPGEEDFGITPVEAMASGLPVIAYGKGGALDTVADGESGVLFDTQSVDGVCRAIRRFEDLEARLDRRRIADGARTFDHENFNRSFLQFVAHAQQRQKNNETAPLAAQAICRHSDR